MKGIVMQLKEGASLQGGRYRIEKVLGQGGFGITYLGVQTGLNRRVAIKEFFMKEYCNREEDTDRVTVPSVGSKELVKRFRQKFVKEAQTIAGMENYHIVRIHEVFEENETAYYVMEYLSGGDLRSWIPKGGMAEPEALSYIRQIADALSYIHERNILHLDIKPGNVLFRSSGEVVLVDFGLSKHYDEASGDQTSNTPLGISEGYAPTEQYECGGVSSFSPATDIYSLGATFYCMLQGERPPKASMVLNDGLPDLPSHISATTRKAIETAMQSRRKDRPQCVNAFLALLDDVETMSTGIPETPSSVPTVPEPPTPVPSAPELKSFPRKWLISLVLVLAVVLGIFGLSKCGGFNSDDGDLLLTDTLTHVDSVSVMDSNGAVSSPNIINGHAWVDLGLSVKWATMNVGATSPGDYGTYFAWGEVRSKSGYTKENSKTWKNNASDISGNSSYDAACCHWGSSWRLPTQSEFQELIDKCRWTWTKENGHVGHKVVGPNGNSIFFPAAGYRYGSSASRVGTHGYYWSSSPYESDTRYACGLYFQDGNRGVNWLYRSYGRSVRPVSD